MPERAQRAHPRLASILKASSEASPETLGRLLAQRASQLAPQLGRLEAEEGLEDKGN